MAVREKRILVECWLFCLWMDESGKGVSVCLESGFWQEVAREPLLL